MLVKINQLKHLIITQLLFIILIFIIILIINLVFIMCNLNNCFNSDHSIDIKQNLFGLSDPSASRAKKNLFSRFIPSFCIPLDPLCEFIENVVTLAKDQLYHSDITKS